MTADEIRSIADDVLGPRLGRFGFDHAEVELKPDHDGEDAIYVNVHFKPGFGAAPARQGTDASNEVRNAIRAKGEPRWTYVWHQYADDEVGVD